MARKRYTERDLPGIVDAGIARLNAIAEVTWKGECTMNMDSGRRSKLLKQIKRGRQTGATQLVRLLVIVGTTIEMFGVYEVVIRQGKGSFALLAAAIGMVFLVAVAAAVSTAMSWSRVQRVLRDGEMTSPMSDMMLEVVKHRYLLGHQRLLQMLEGLTE